MLTSLYDIVKTKSFLNPLKIVTFRDLQKFIQSGAEAIANLKISFQKLQGLPFWIFDREQHRQQDLRTKGHCCFNHAIGLPQKDGHDMPLLPYQRTLYEVLQNHNHFRRHWQPPLGITGILDTVMLELTSLKG